MTALAFSQAHEFLSKECDNKDCDKDKRNRRASRSTALIRNDQTREHADKTDKNRQGKHAFKGQAKSHGN